jgi:periplasmic protein TonB
VTHDSLIRHPSGRMSPAALTLAAGVHALVGATLWWISPLRPHDQTETAIMVTVEPEPSGGAPAAGGAPPAAESDARPSDEPPQEEIQQALAPVEPMPAEPMPAEPAPAPPSPAEQAQPPSQPEPESQPTEAETEDRWQTEASSWRPQVTFEQSVPSPETAPLPTSRDVASSAPQRPAAATRPVQRAQTAPPRPAPQRMPSESQATASAPSTSGSASDSLMGLGGQRNDYLSRVFRHIEPFRSYPASARENRQSGRVVTRVTINRDGQLIDVRIDRSSGWPAIDDAEITAIRQAMPLPPVPSGMPGDPIVLILPMNYGIR